MEGDVTMKPLDERERLQSTLQATEQVMQALRAVTHDPAVAQLLETKQCEAEQTRVALRAIRPIRTQLKAAVEGRDKLTKKHAADADGVQSLGWHSWQAKQAEFAELAHAPIQLVAQLQEREREYAGRKACRGALHSHWQCPRRHVCSAAGARVGYNVGRFSGSVI